MSWKENASMYITIVMSAITTGAAWLIGKAQGKANLKKTLAEVDVTSGTAEEKYRQLEDERFEKLVDRLATSEKLIEEFRVKVKLITDELLTLQMIHQETQAELNLYKTIKSHQ